MLTVNIIGTKITKMRHFRNVIVNQIVMEKEMVKVMETVKRLQYQYSKVAV